MKILKRIIKIVLSSIVFILILIIFLYGHRDIPVSELKSKYASPPSSFVLIDGMDVHYRDEGNINDTIPIVLIHGTGASLHTFDDWTTKLKNEHRVVRMDLPAFGLTGPFLHRTYSIENYVIFVEQFLSSRGITKCIMAGNSLGGRIAWNFTIKKPDFVEKLILIDASGYPTISESTPIAFKIAGITVLNKLLTFITPRFMVRASLEDVYFDKSKVTDPLVDRYFDLTLRDGNRQGLVDRLSSPVETSAHEYISSIKQPTLILWGEQDYLVPVSNAYRFDDDLPNDTLVILNDLGHVPMEESPEISLQPVIEFLNSK